MWGSNKLDLGFKAMSYKMQCTLCEGRVWDGFLILLRGFGAKMRSNSALGLWEAEKAAQFSAPHTSRRDENLDGRRPGVYARPRSTKSLLRLALRYLPGSMMAMRLIPSWYLACE